MTDMETNKRENPKVVINLLTLLNKTDIDLETIERARTEKFLRELYSLPLSMFAKASLKVDFDKMKNLAKDLCKKWAD